MSMLTDTIGTFNSAILPRVLPKWKRRFRFGFLALSLRPIDSLNANARSIIANRKTAASAVYRLCRSTRIVQMFPTILTHLGIIRAGDHINVDFSDFHGLQVLTFAKQTRAGRAIPLFFATIRYPIPEGSQNTFIIAETARFLAAIGVPVHLVFDRGFELPAFIRFLAQRSDVQFTVRLKSMKHVVTTSGRHVSIRNLPTRDAIITAYGHALRVIRSPRAAGAKEPWYLLTNDRTTTAEDIVTTYVHRFEIEEFFKDAKRLADIEYLTRSTSDRTCTIVLWFVILSCWIAWITEGIRSAWETFRTETNRHHWCSLLRFWWEDIRWECTAAIRVFLAPPAEGAGRM